MTEANIPHSLWVRDGITAGAFDGFIGKTAAANHPDDWNVASAVFGKLSCPYQSSCFLCPLDSLPAGPSIKVQAVMLLVRSLSHLPSVIACLLRCVITKVSTQVLAQNEDSPAEASGPKSATFYLAAKESPAQPRARRDLSYAPCYAGVVTLILDSILPPMLG